MPFTIAQMPAKTNNEAARVRKTCPLVPDLLVLARSALAVIRDLQRARDLMNRLVEVASRLGLYAEHLDVKTGRRLGNFPQAFSNLAAVVAAATIVLGDRGEELMR